MLNWVKGLELSTLLLLLLLVLALTPSSLAGIGTGAHRTVDINHANAPLRECRANQPCVCYLRPEGAETTARMLIWPLSVEALSRGGVVGSASDS